jgi:hypothetical protein
MMRVREGLGLIASSEGRGWLSFTLRKRLYSRVVSIGVRRDLEEYVAGDPARDLDAVPPAKIPIVVRKLEPGDDLSFLDDDPDLDPRSRQVRADQRWLMTGDLPTPWVALDSNGAVCFMSFLLRASDNAAIRARWGDLLPELQPDEAAVEGPYAGENMRGLGMMKDVLRQVLLAERDDGVRYVLGFIGDANAPSLAVANYGGFDPYLKREESWLLFRRRIRFVPYEDATARTSTA